jgi:hypothetical protein
MLRVLGFLQQYKKTFYWKKAKRKPVVIIWKSVPVLVKQKCWHIHKIGKRRHQDFTVDYGDVPVGRINPFTGRFEECVNTRGLAYAARNRLKYKPNRKKF